MNEVKTLDDFRRTRSLGTDDAGEPIFLYLNGESDKLDTGVYIHIADGEFQMYLGNTLHTDLGLDRLEAVLFGWCIADGRIKA